MKPFLKYGAVFLGGAAIVMMAAFFPFDRILPPKPTESIEETTEGPAPETEAPTETLPPETEPVYEAGTVYGKLYVQRDRSDSLEGMGQEEAFYAAASFMNHVLMREVKIWGTDPVSEDMTLRGQRTPKALGAVFDQEAAKKAITEHTLSGSQEEMREQVRMLDQADPVYLSDFVSVEKDWFYSSVIPLFPEEKEVTEAGYTIEADGTMALLSDDEDGYAFDTETALEDLESILGYWLRGGERERALEVRGGTVKAVISSDDVLSFTILGEYTTPFDPNAHERNKNLVACVMHMNGTVVKPGHTMSALDMYGEVTEENGFVGAPTMINGQHVLDIGGGMCQPTSTLYNAILLSELEIVFRRNHSMYVNYGGPSRDAMVYAKTGSDFIFRNCKDSAIIVVSSIDLKAGNLNVKILGREDRPKDHEISFHWETWDYVMPTVTRTIDPTAPIGYTGYERKVINTNEQWPQCGFKSNLYKITKEGGKTWETLINKNDVYYPANSDFLCAPDFTVVVRFNPDSPLTAYLDVYYAWLDGTPTGVNIGTWKSKDIRAFNERMKKLMAEEGYVWPYSGTAPFR